MMELVIVAVRDSAIKAFMTPFFVTAVGAAMRSFQDEVGRAAADNPLYKHPEDYELFELGLYEDGSGRIHMLPEPRSLCRGKDFAEVSYDAKSSAAR